MSNVSYGRAVMTHLLDTSLAEGDDTLGTTVRMPFVLPGEVVEFECFSHKKRKTYFPKTIVKESVDRTTPICAHFKECGGCMLQHMGQRLYHDFKKKLVTDAFLAHGLDPFLVQEITILPFGKRRRANMDGILKPEGLFLGFHKYQAHRITDIKECHTLDPLIVNVLPSLKEAIAKVLGLYQKIKIFFTLTDTGVDIIFEIQGINALNGEQKEILHSFAKNNDLARLMFRYRKTKDIIWQKTTPVVNLGGVDVEVDAYSFLQASKDSDIFLANFVQTHALCAQTSNATALTAVDLFCGRGTLSLPLCKSFSVTGFECDKGAVDALNDAAQKANVDLSASFRNLFDEPLTTAELDAFDIALINPPRAGAQEQAQHLKSSCVKKIIYVSCNPETFARDLALLTGASGRFKIDTIHVLDQFAWSAHVEVLGVLTPR